MKQITLKEVDKFIDDTMSGSITSDSWYYFSPSALPYCPILDYYERKSDYKQKIKPQNEQTFTLDFYCNTGTVVHELLQYYGSLMKKSGKQYGRWKCGSCGSIIKGFKPKVCDCGYKHFEYKEIEFQKDKCWGMHAYCDNLVRMKIKNPISGKNKKCWVLYEYKTKGIDYITNEYKSKYLPESKHLIQARSYCCMLKKQENIKVDYMCIVYIPRDAPFDYKTQKNLFKTCTYEITDDIIETTEKELDRAYKGHSMLVKCSESEFKKYKQKFIDLRPCINERTYLNYMKAKFFGKTECPIKKYCINCIINKDNLNKLLDKNKDKLDEILS